MAKKTRKPTSRSCPLPRKTMQFKEKKMRDQLFAANTLLLRMANQFEILSMRLGKEAVVTRVSDYFDGESGVHLVGRGIDFRDDHMGKRLYTDDEAEKLCKNMNNTFERYDGKHTCIHHSFYGAPVHFHIQVAADFSAYLPKQEETVANHELFKEESNEQLEESPQT
jgi:hypothetical protein